MFLFPMLADDTYSYSYDTTSSSSGSLGAGFIVGMLIFDLVIYLLAGFILSRVFRKAGRPGWAAFVPFYNSWVMFELGGRSGANIFWAFLPLVGSIVFLVKYIQAMLEIGRRFGKSTVFSVFGLIIFSLIGYIILAFDDSKYQDETSHGNFNPPAGPPAGQPSAYAAPQPPQPAYNPGPVTDVPAAGPTPQPPQIIQPPQAQPPETPQPPVGGVSG